MKDNIITSSNVIDYEKLLESYRLTDRVLLQSLDNCSLTLYEKVICYFICKQVRLKEIASYLEHSYDSIKKTKQRIVYKLNLKEENTSILIKLSSKIRHE